MFKSFPPLEVLRLRHSLPHCLICKSSTEDTHFTITEEDTRTKISLFLIFFAVNTKVLPQLKLANNDENRLTVTLTTIKG